jgi:hypothetical protein
MPYDKLVQQFAKGDVNRDRAVYKPVLRQVSGGEDAVDA